MIVSRRAFLQYCGLSAAYLGLKSTELGRLNEVLAAAPDPGPSVVWLQGSACVGCSISLLNHISDTVGEPADVADLLTNHINLIYHPTLMALAGDSAVASLRQVYEEGNYILVVEGGVPTAYNGYCCVAYSFDGQEITFKEAVETYAGRAAHLVCVGTCASWGGIPKAGSNPTGIKGVSELLGQTTINLSGCPANPMWVVKAIVKLLLGQNVPLDEYGRPVELYEAFGNIHDSCPRWQDGNNKATELAQDGKCLWDLGCRGPSTKANCYRNWNGIAGMGQWCIGVNAPCHGCTEPGFPGPESFYELYSPDA